MMAAATALAASVNATKPGDSLLPPLADIRAVSRSIAVAVATAAVEQGHAGPLTAAEIEAAVDSRMWHADYRSYLAD
jgi:malate dehydrogenase (oxaloacetate-decarboxylating)